MRLGLLSLFCRVHNRRGTTGFVLIHASNAVMSLASIARTRTRSKRCSFTLAGKTVQSIRGIQAPNSLEKSDDGVVQLQQGRSSLETVPCAAGTVGGTACSRL